MSKEWMETLNLKTSIVVGDGKLAFELYSIEKGVIKEVKINNDVFVLNNGFKQNNETRITKTGENDISVPQPVNKEDKIEELIVDMINGEKDKIIPPVIPLVKSTVNKSFNTIYGVDDIIASPGEYITCALYKTVLDEILNNVSPVFYGRDVSNIILDVYKKIGRRISTGSAYVYSGAYRRYMLDHGLIQVKDEIKKIYEVVNVDEGKTVEEIVEDELVSPVKKKTQPQFSKRELNKMFIRHRDNVIDDLRRRRTKHRNLSIGDIKKKTLDVKINEQKNI